MNIYFASTSANGLYDFVIAIKNDFAMLLVLHQGQLLADRIQPDGISSKNRQEIQEVVTELKDNSYLAYVIWPNVEWPKLKEYRELTQSYYTAATQAIIDVFLKEKLSKDDLEEYATDKANTINNRLESGQTESTIIQIVTLISENHFADAKVLCDTFGLDVNDYIRNDKRYNKISRKPKKGTK